MKKHPSLLFNQEEHLQIIIFYTLVTKASGGTVLTFKFKLETTTACRVSGQESHKLRSHLAPRLVGTNNALLRSAVAIKL